MKKKVKEWIERGAHDLEAARLLLDHQAHADTVLFHIHQAVEKYLEGFLIHHGWGLEKIHDLETLITKAIDFDDAFARYLDVGRKLTAFYYMERYPPGPVPTYASDKTRQMLQAASELVEKIEDKLQV